MSRDVVAFDIGTRNFAMAWLQLQDGAKGPVVRHMSLVDLAGAAGGRPRESWALYRELIRHLESFDTIFLGHRPVILIEQQMATKHRSNIQALRLSQHVLAFFLHRHPALRVIEYSPRHKTRSVSTGSDAVRMSYRERKQWAVGQCTTFMQDDPVATDWFTSFPKKDDVADCILMCHTFLRPPSS